MHSPTDPAPISARITIYEHASDGTHVVRHRLRQVIRMRGLGHILTVATPLETLCRRDPTLDRKSALRLAWHRYPCELLLWRPCADCEREARR